MPFGPYRSRALAWIARRSLRLSQQLGHTWRRLRVAAAWSGQVLLYPLYLLVRGSFALASTQPPTGRLPGDAPPSADAPIRATLAAIRIRYSARGELKSAEVLGAHPALLAPWQGLKRALVRERTASAERAAIRGVAVLRESGEPVLVGADNQALPLLAPAQQHALQHYLRQQLAAYWYRHEFDSPFSRFPPLQPAALGPPGRRPNSLAIALNLFDEARSAPSPQLLAVRLRQASDRLEGWAQRLGRAAGSEPTPSAAEGTPWLSWSDLYAAPTPEQAPLESSSEQQGWWDQLQDALAPEEEEAEAAEAIETPARASGYVRHPLARLLVWLDGALLWLEQRLARLGQWLRRGGQGR